MEQFFILHFREKFSDALMLSENFTDEDIKDFLFKIIVHTKNNLGLSNKLNSIIQDTSSYFEDLAEAYYDNPAIQDELINECLLLNYDIFKSHLQLIQEIRIALARNERTALKSVLLEKENELEEQEIEQAISKQIRFELKQELKTHELKHPQHTHTTIHSTLRNYSIIYKLAGIILLITIPVSILIFINNSSTEKPLHIAQKPTTKVADTVITDQIPEQFYQLANSANNLKSNTISHQQKAEVIFETTPFGYAYYMRSEIDIKIYSNHTQINSVLNPYIDNIVQAIDSINKLNVNQIQKDSITTLLKKALAKSLNQKKILLTQDMTYDFFENNLVLRINRPINKTQLRIFGLLDYEASTSILVLNFDNQYYSIQEGRNLRLIPFKDEDIIERIKDLDEI